MTHACQIFAKLITIAVLLSAAAIAQPTVTQVKDLAANIPQGFPFYSIAPGGGVEIYGTGMGPDQRVSDYPSFPLGLTLAGTSVEVTVEDTTVSALMTSTSDQRITAILPTGTPLGSGQLRVTYNGETSDPFDIIVANSVGIFTQNGEGSGPALAINADFEPISTINPAHPGEIIMVLLSAGGVAMASPALSPATDQAMSLDALKKKMKTGDPKEFARASDNPMLGVAVHFGEEMQTPPLMYGSLFPGISYVIFQVPDVLGCWVPFFIEGDSSLGVYHSSYAQLAIATILDLVCRDPYGISYQTRLGLRDEFYASGGFQAPKSMKPYLTKFELLIAHLIRGEIYGGYPSLLFPELHFGISAAELKLKSYVHLGSASYGTQVIYSPPTVKRLPNFLDLGNMITLQGNESTVLARQDDGTYHVSQNYLSNLGPNLSLSYTYNDQSYTSDIDLGVQGIGESPDIDKLTPYPVNAADGVQFKILSSLPQDFRYRVEFTTCIQSGYCATIVKITQSQMIDFSAWELGHLPSSNNARLIVFIESIPSGTISGFPSKYPLVNSIHSSGATVLDRIEFSNPQVWQVNAF